MGPFRACRIFGQSSVYTSQRPCTARTRVPRGLCARRIVQLARFSVYIVSAARPTVRSGLRREAQRRCRSGRRGCTHAVVFPRELTGCAALSPGDFWAPPATFYFPRASHLRPCSPQRLRVRGGACRLLALWSFAAAPANSRRTIRWSSFSTARDFSAAVGGPSSSLGSPLRV